MKTHVLILAKTFPKNRSFFFNPGGPTHFKEAFLNGQRCVKCPIIDPTDKDAKLVSEICGDCRKRYCNKIHTIRANYSLWESRMQEVFEGKAILSIREWEGTPYWSRQVEIAALDQKTLGNTIGLEKLEVSRGGLIHHLDISANNQKITWGWKVGEPGRVAIENFAYNDGLTMSQLEQMLIDIEEDEPLAIIHFTPYRYTL